MFFIPYIRPCFFPTMAQKCFSSSSLSVDMLYCYCSVSLWLYNTCAISRGLKMKCYFNASFCKLTRNSLSWHALGRIARQVSRADGDNVATVCGKWFATALPKSFASVAPALFTHFGLQVKNENLDGHLLPRAVWSREMHCRFFGSGFKAALQWWY